MSSFLCCEMQIQPEQKRVQVGNTGVQLFLLWGDKWVLGGPWAMVHLAYFWHDNFKSYFGRSHTFVQ